MPVVRTSNHSVQIDNGSGRSTLSLIQSGTGKVSVNITGPRGGNEQALVVSADDLLEALEELGVISKVAAWNYVEIVTDGCCPVCGAEIALNDVICDSCLDSANARRA